MMMPRMAPTAAAAAQPAKPVEQVPPDNAPAGKAVKAVAKPSTQQPPSKVVLPETTAEESRNARQASLARYRAKKARRLTSNKIRYHLRKVNADNRPRFKGRFVKKEEIANCVPTVDVKAE